MRMIFRSRSRSASSSRISWPVGAWGTGRNSVRSGCCAGSTAASGYCSAWPEWTRRGKAFRGLFSGAGGFFPHGPARRAPPAPHREHPYVLNVEGVQASIDYEPAESTTAMFGGNSNWRGPLWFPLNYLVIAALERYY